jgi:hypothetical protein
MLVEYLFHTTHDRRTGVVKDSYAKRSLNGSICAVHGGSLLRLSKNAHLRFGRLTALSKVDPSI